VTNSPVFPEHVLLSRPVLAVFYKVMKMSWFQKNCSERSALQQNRWANNEDEEEKQDKRKKTKDINIFCYFVCESYFCSIWRYFF